MERLVICALILLAGMATTGLAAEAGKESGLPSDKASQQVVTSITPQEIVKILAAEGYANATVEDDGTVKVKMNGQSVWYTLNGERTSVGAMFGVRTTNVSIGKINNWNRSRRYSRAFLSEDFVPMLESDLMIDAGVTLETVKQFIVLFEVMQRAFIKEVLD